MTAPTQTLGAGRQDDFVSEPMAAHNLEAVAAMAARLHPDLLERPEVFAERVRLFPDGCRVLQRASGAISGYGIAYPWRLHSVPPLDGFVERLPDDADCLYVHDVAILPEGRGQRGAERFVALIQAAARARGIARLSCVSVYGTDVFWRPFGFVADPVPALAADLTGYGESAKYMAAAVD